MERKRFELVLAAVFFVAGVFLLIFSQARVTGGVIGVNAASSLLMFIGFLLLCSSLISFVSNPSMVSHKLTLEEQIEAELNRLDQRMREFEPDPSKTLVVVDSSLMIKYKDSPVQLEAFLKKYNHVFVPKSVYDEVKNAGLRNILRKYDQGFKPPTDYNAIQVQVRGFLASTSKQRAYDFLRPFLTGEKKPLASDMARISEESVQVRRWMQRDEWDKFGARENPKIFFTAMLDYLKNNKVSDGDVDVMSTAVALALTKGAKTVIVGLDSHFEEAVPKTWQANSSLASNLRYFKCAETPAYGQRMV